MCSHPGVDPPRGLNDSHAEPCTAAALHDSAPPSPPFLSPTESSCSAALPTAAASASLAGATLSVATGGGLLGVFSTLHAATSNSSRGHPAPPIARRPTPVTPLRLR